MLDKEMAVIKYMYVCMFTVLEVFKILFYVQIPLE